MKARIDEDVWQKGYTVTYYLSTAAVDNGYVLSISPASSSFTNAGGTDVITIKSYKQTYYGSQVAMPWTASYTYDEAGTTGTTVYNSTNSVVTGFTASSNGSITGENVNFTVASGGTATATAVYKSSSETESHIVTGK